MEHIVQKILKELNKDYNYIVKKKRGSSPEIRLGDFLLATIKWSRAKDTCSELGISAQTFNRLVKREFPGVKLTGGGETWSYYFLSLAEYKRCFKCAKVKKYSEYYNSESVSHCIECHSSKNKEYYAERKDIWDNYYDANKSDYLERNARRRAVVKQATPTWANKDKLKEIYANCPIGYHVDHIVPLRGLNVCGLHVENNLQYLTEEENLKKHNKF